MTPVLGLSITTTSIGWVLVDRSGTERDTLDHDAFDLNANSAAAADCSSQYAAAVRGAQAIAAASGHQVHSIGVTWSHDVEAEAKRLLESLADSEFQNVVGMRLSQATEMWARGIARDLGYENPAICVIEPAAATVLTVGSGDGTVQTTTTHSRDGAEGLSRWLTAVFDQNGERPEELFLVGSRKDLKEVAGSLDSALPMTVFCSAEDQLALARGAALSLASDEEGSQDQPAPNRSWFAHARAGTVVAASVSTVIALCAADSQLASGTDFRDTDKPPAAADISVPPDASFVPKPPAAAPPAPPVALPVGLAVPPPPPPPPPPPEVVAEPSAYPAAVEPVEAAPQPAAPPAAPVPAQPPTPPPAEASHLSPGPPPAAGPVPAPPPPAPPPAPQDPLGVVLSPLFSALP
jgi:hypothetical protein